MYYRWFAIKLHCVLQFNILKRPVEEKLLVETDSPFLAPQAQRGKRNEPSFVNYVVDTLSECYQSQREEIVKQSTLNAQKLFAI